MTPDQMLAKVRRMADAIAELNDREVAVGLPAEEAGGQVYDDGESIVTVGAKHEYGEGVPQRSFLRAPFEARADVMDATIQQEWRRIGDGRQDVSTALGRVGVQAANISREAFETGGFGEWPQLSAVTKAIKADKGSEGGGRILVDTGLLFGAITWVVR